MPQTILVIGAGITGALCASSLYKSLPNATIKVWDKARGVGGRMTTSRGPDGIVAQADLGAQYITTDNKVLETENYIYGRLLSKKLIKQLDHNVEGMKALQPGVSNFVAPKGMSSIVKLFLSDLPADSITLNQMVASIKLDEGKFKVTTNKNNSIDADVVICTIPIPQFLKLEGVNALVTATSLNNLQKVTYSTRFVLIWFYESTSGLSTPDWVAKYIDNDDIFRYVAIDNIKRGTADNPAIVFHTTVQYGTKNILKTKDEVLEELNERAHKLFPQWPKPAALKSHKWLYSQVQEYYPDKPACVVLNSRPALILAGDAFSSSNFNGCIASANEAVKKALSFTQ